MWFFEFKMAALIWYYMVAFGCEAYEIEHQAEIDRFDRAQLAPKLQ